MITMTYKLAMAAGQDAANRLMRSKNLTTWDDECAAMAVETYQRLYGDAFLREINGLADDTAADHPDYPCPDDPEGLHHIGCGCEF